MFPECSISLNPFTTHVVRGLETFLVHVVVVVVVDLEREETGWSSGKDNEWPIMNGGGGWL